MNTTCPEISPLGQFRVVSDSALAIRWPALYALGNLLGTEELLFTPLYNPFDPNRPGSPARLAVPNAASAIAAALDSTGASHLFVAGDEALVHFAPSKQQDGATGTQVVTSSLISGVQSLHAAATAGTTIVWGLNQQNQLFYVRCKADSEDDPSAWSYPLPILTGVQQIAPLLNPGHDNSVIFAHADGQSVIQLTQVPGDEPLATTLHRAALDQILMTSSPTRA